MRAYRQWTDVEVAVLMEHYRQKGGPRKCTILLGRSISQVRHAARYYGLSAPRKNALWKPKEIALLKENYGVEHTVVVARMLNRSYRAVLQKACDLGLQSQGLRDGWYTLMDACAVLGVAPKTMRKWLLDGTIKADRPARADGLGGDGHMWRITAKALRTFVVNHASTLQGRAVDISGLVALLVET